MAQCPPIEIQVAQLHSSPQHAPLMDLLPLLRGACVLDEFFIGEVDFVHTFVHLSIPPFI